MFEKYFVTCPVAVALKAAGFDEPCMATYEYCVTEEPGSDMKFRIQYDSAPPDPTIYNEIIRENMVKRPGMFEPKLRNSQLPVWLYAAPLYDQVFEWFMSKGLYLHPYYISPVASSNSKGIYGCNIYDGSDNGLLWPQWALNYIKSYHFEDKRDAIEQAILEAIKLLPNEPKNG